MRRNKKTKLENKVKWIKKEMDKKKMKMKNVFGKLNYGGEI